MLKTRIKIVEARLKMKRHPEDHACGIESVVVGGGGGGGVVCVNVYMVKMYDYDKWLWEQSMNNIDRIFCKSILFA
ncbi:hypothetical protein Tco_0360112 [Tanacetum coccineum]